MEEKIIIQSEYDKKALKIISVLRILLLIIALFSFFSAFLDWDQDCYVWSLLVKGGSTMSKPKITDYGSFWLSVLSVVLIVVVIIIKKMAKKCSLNVTSSRIWGCTAFGKQVDLPVDSVSAIGKGAFSSIAISTSSGSIKFLAIKNQNEIYNVLNQLLINRQNINNQRGNSASVGYVPSNTETLKEYKSLLDMGVITQAEFDAKKTQLLNLSGNFATANDAPVNTASANVVTPVRQVYMCPTCKGSINHGDVMCKNCGTVFNW